MWFSLLSAALVALLSTCYGLSASGSRLLVVLDDIALKDKYSKLWGDLEIRGFQVTFETPKTDPSLFRHGERAYDHLFILPSKLKTLGPALSPNTLLEFIKEDGNILLALSSDIPTPATLSALLLELDIQLPTDRNTVTVDHFNYDVVSSAEKHDVLLVPATRPVRTDVKHFFARDKTLAVPRAVPQVLGATSPLLSTILRAPPTAYSYNPTDEADAVEDPFAAGGQMALVSAMQARNSARFTVLGSAEMLEDQWFGANVRTPRGSQERAGNQEFARKITGWTFKELGVLKVGTVQHYLDEEGASSSNSSMTAKANLNPIYRIKNDVTYAIELSEYSYDHYAPYVPAPGDDVQLEFSMLSPYHRLPLKPSSRGPNSTIYSTSFRLPDQHGIFNFLVNYKRPFLTNVYEKRTVTVRHFAHDEWPRSWTITGAWPWIAGVWMTVAGWLAFVAIWLYSAPQDVPSTLKKTQ